MFNLRTVIKFEVLRTIKKPNFWIAALSVPLVYAVIFGLGWLSGMQTKEDQDKLAKESFSFEIQDESGYISSEIVKNVNGVLSNNKIGSIEKVRAGKIKAFYYLPKNLEKEPVEVYGENININENLKYSAVLKTIIKNSISRATTVNQLALINETYKTEETVFKDGKKYNQISEMIIPGMFLVLFYVVTVFFTNRMLTSTTEEKENRVTEMILTSIKAKTLILGKIISIIILGFFQIITMISPILIGLLIIVNIPNASSNLGLNQLFEIITNIKWDFSRIAVSAAILIAGFLMTTGAIVALGAAVPTAQEASGYFGVIIMCLMSPLFVISSFFATEPSLIVQVLSFFPLTSPIALLFRNTLGTLSFIEVAIGVGMLSIFAVISIWLAVKIFQYGTISYNSKVSLKSLFAKKKSV